MMFGNVEESQGFGNKAELETAGWGACLDFLAKSYTRWFL